MQVYLEVSYEEVEGGEVLGCVLGFDEIDFSIWGNLLWNDVCFCGLGKKFKYCYGVFV